MKGGGLTASLLPPTTKKSTITTNPTTEWITLIN